MPLPITQPSARSTHKVIQLPAGAAVGDHAAKTEKGFFASELAHWLADLEQRRREGAYYLNLLVWFESGFSNSKQLASLPHLLKSILPALQQLIQECLSLPDLGQMEDIKSLQQQYFRFCDHFDQIKLLLLKEIDLGYRLFIY